MADKPIGQLNDFPAGADIGTTNTLLVAQYANAAYKLNGQRFVTALATLLDGHGGIASITYTPPTSPSLDGTMTITFADATTTTVTVKNGKGISSIAKQGTSGLVDTYRITYNDDTTSTFTVTNGAKGDTGTPAYVHIRYATVKPTKDSDMTTQPNAWMGIYSGSSSTAPTDHRDYNWGEIKGTKGDRGDPGISIVSIELTSGSHQPGTLDTYTITYSDDSTSTFQVYNGIDGTGAGTVTSVAVEIASNGGLSVTGSPITSNGTIVLSHSNSVTAQATLGIYPIRIDANGHITAYGTKPTTLDGFGITDAKIQNGVITLGNNTITPLTQHQDISGKADISGTNDISVSKASLSSSAVTVSNTTDTTANAYANVALYASSTGGCGLYDNRYNHWIVGDKDGKLFLFFNGHLYTLQVGTAGQADADHITIVLES